MKSVVEISLYPLNQKYLAPIQDFIDRLNSYPQLTTSTSDTSTIVRGDMTELMGILNTEMQKTYTEVGQAIFVCKFLNGDAMGESN
ncbi:YkoF family thiamine/hydroxymethylpyrimidine-binding protein [Aliiglaciecola sp. SL4]|uniref:YkoF family thiamine/hydroxymethylpyrimidine-binding protein n=1 Tax=Aliiglaciecola sp. SL4 TaxID=3239806 RepID=UPI00355BC244